MGVGPGSSNSANADNLLGKGLGKGSVGPRVTIVLESSPLPSLSHIPEDFLNQEQIFLLPLSAQ